MKTKNIIKEFQTHLFKSIMAVRSSTRQYKVLSTMEYIK